MLHASMCTQSSTGGSKGALLSCDSLQKHKALPCGSPLLSAHGFPCLYLHHQSLVRRVFSDRYHDVLYTFYSAPGSQVRPPGVDLALPGAGQLTAGAACSCIHASKECLLVC